jgi:hypothetical protein
MANKKRKVEISNGVLENSESNSSNSSGNLLQDISAMRSNNQVGTDEFVDKMKQLEVLLGVSEISPFGTNELEIFERTLAEASLSEMQKIANKVGINPFHDRPTLKSSLLREFGAYTKNSRRNIMPSSVNSFVVDPNNPKHQKLIKILNDI